MIQNLRLIELKMRLTENINKNYGFGGFTIKKHSLLRNYYFFSMDRKCMVNEISCRQSLTQ